MKVGIFFAGKTGTTAKCATELGTYFKEVDLINLATDQFDLSNYHVIIIGSSIRLKKMHKKVFKFISENYEVLLKKKVAYFICNLYTNKFEKFLEKNINKELLNRAIYTASFGGEIDINKQRGFDKFIINLLTKNKDFKYPTIIHDEIADFAKHIHEIGFR